MTSLLKQVEKLISEITLCAPCLGRQFGQLLTGTTNKNRGEALLLSIGLGLHYDIINQDKALSDYETITHLPFSILRDSYDKIASKAEVQSLSINPMEASAVNKLEKLPDIKPCFICKGLFDNDQLYKYAELICAHAKHFEFTRFLVGSKIPSDMVEREENMRAKFNLTQGESIKSHINREIGKIIALDSLFSEKELDFNTPDIVFIANIEDEMIDIQNNPLFIYGKYNKLERGIPQTVWFCSNCWGKGCETCEYSGRKHPNAIEEYIIPILIQKCQAKNGKFHGSGREDVDALMLGDGRPFVAQINEPKIRNINLDAIESTINNKTDNKVKVKLIEITDRNRVRDIKNKSPNMSKHYKLGVKLSEPKKIDLSLIKNLIGIIEQQTPNRVIHRRADLTRTREVFEVFGRQLDEEHLEVEVICSGGLYVKELIHGDSGRTKPCLSEILGMALQVEFLDVLKVEDFK